MNQRKASQTDIGKRGASKEDTRVLPIPESAGKIDPIVEQLLHDLVSVALAIAARDGSDREEEDGSANEI